jgi:hypothetical protein
MPARLLIVRMSAAFCVLAVAGEVAHGQSASTDRAAAAVIPQAVMPQPGVSDSVMRRVVAERFPGAFTGAMGARPFVWILADGEDRVLRTASGRDGLSRSPAGQEGLEWAGAARKLEGMPRSARPGDILQLGRVAAGADTVMVAWVRLQAGLPSR